MEASARRGAWRIDQRPHERAQREQHKRARAVRVEQRADHAFGRFDVREREGALSKKCREVEAALKALRSGERKLFVLSYGWGTRNHPDPQGIVLANVVSFFKYIEKELMLTPDDLKEYGLFWDFPCLHQRPRSASEEWMWKRRLLSRDW